MRNSGSLYEDRTVGVRGVEEGWKRGGRGVEERWKSDGKGVEERWKRGGRGVEERRFHFTAEL